MAEFKKQKCSSSRLRRRSGGGDGRVVELPEPISRRPDPALTPSPRLALTLTPTRAQAPSAQPNPRQAGFDPISRKPLQRIEQAVPNLALKEAISDFLAEHPWAYQCTL